MRVFTYHEPVAGLPDAGKLVALWQQSWHAQGWGTVVFGEGTVREHPDYQKFKDRVATYPSSNPPGYDLACYLRHLGMIQFGGGLLVDYDVMNRSFTPEDGEAAWERASASPNGVLMLEVFRCPCAIVATTTGYENICSKLTAHNPAGEQHTSDNNILSRYDDLEIGGQCAEFLGGGNLHDTSPEAAWRRSPLVHFSNNGLRKFGCRGDKSAFIRSLGPGYDSLNVRKPSPAWTPLAAQA